jgi:hypothetical protein
MKDFRNAETGKYDVYAWPGGYEIEYDTADGRVLCGNCANDQLAKSVDPDWPESHIVGVSLDCDHDEPAYCDHCGHAFDAYGVLESTPAAQHDQDDEYCDLCGGSCSIYPG